MGKDEKEVFIEKQPCSQSNCIARNDDCTENYDMCFWKDENWEKEED